jgi:hypothetical protein
MLLPIDLETHVLWVNFDKENYKHIKDYNSVGLVVENEIVYGNCYDVLLIEKGQKYWEGTMPPEFEIQDVFFAPSLDALISYFVASIAGTASDVYKVKEV